MNPHGAVHSDQVLLAGIPDTKAPAKAVINPVMLDASSSRTGGGMIE